MLWLYSVAALVFAMVVVGAITRLTDSGLSMVEWRPLLGVIPPLGHDEWERVYGLYQASPQFIKENSWMGLQDFKNIFFWEWFHRFLGRFIGIAYAVPLIVFWIQGKIPAGYKTPLILIFLLGGAQGFMGWYMVKSGLVDHPEVSHFRLAAHLGLAFVIFGSLIWAARDFARHTPAPNKPLFIHGLLSLVMIGVTITWGAFTAGLDAGLIYNTHFPMMTAQQWLPDGRDIFNDHGAVQFVHRWLALLTVFTTLSWWGHSLLRKHTIRALHILAIVICAQLSLGVATLLSGVSIHIAVTHQAGALLSLFFILISIHKLRPRNA